MIPLHQQSFDDLPLARRPLPSLADLAFEVRALDFRQADAIVAQVGLEPIAYLSGAFDRLAMGVKPVATFLGLGIGHPDLLGGPGQVGLANAHGADLVIVGVGLLELAQMATFQDFGSP